MSIESDSRESDVEQAGTSGDSIVEQEHWDAFHSGRPRMRLPSRLAPAVRNADRLLTPFLASGKQVLEIGFAPGKQLAAVAAWHGALVSGIDYSESRVNTGIELFRTVGIEGDLRNENIFDNSFEPDSFDLVYSLGVIEHFTDPVPVVSEHVKLTKSDGVSVIAIPNYGGWMGRIQAKYDPENLNIHNTEMMNVSALEEIGRRAGASTVRAYAFGSFDPSIISWHRILGGSAGRLTLRLLGALALLQPFQISGIAPWLVLELRK